jgi:hypothetical protein
VHWRELLTAHLVADFLIEQPQVYINLANFRAEQKSKVPIQKKGWQQALESIYPLKINVFQIHNGDLTYVDRGPYRPLHASHLDFRASNIRNIRDPQNAYPSAVHFEGRVFEKGALVLDGNANFLEEPHISVKAAFALRDIDLSYFEPILARSNISVRRGTLSTQGRLEYNPSVMAVNLKNIDFSGVDADYVHLPQTMIAEQERVTRAAEAAKGLSNEPTAQIRFGDLSIRESTLAYVNKTTNPNYRLTFNGITGTMSHFSNQFVEGPATLDLRARFMGTGTTHVAGTFRPYTKDPNFDLSIAIENTDMRPMSDLFRAFGNFDIKAGSFSFYSKLQINGNYVSGFVKPIFKDLKVEDRRPSGEKSIFHRLYVGMVGGIATLLENRAHKQVATKADISGPLADPQTSIVQIILRLVENAWIKAILPGFDKETANTSK